MLRRSALIDFVFYNNESSMWNDFVYTEEKRQSDFYVSNFAVLWAAEEHILS